jgi:protein-S-isoprenylcysteine O-methyltransferase Ste14
MKDRLGLAFFTFTAIVMLLAAWDRPTVLAWLVALHNALLAFLYTRRKPADLYDHKGLWLGLLAAMLPLATPYPAKAPFLVILFGILGYSLIFWSLLALGSHFGIAPADRGLIKHGPYRWVRHPMYLGELILRAALIIPSSNSYIAVASLISLGVVQVLRTYREEQIIAGYTAYAHQVRYRLIPGVW